MSKRRKNLLDAFRASAPSKNAPAQPDLFEPVRPQPTRAEPRASAHPSQGPLPARVQSPAPPQQQPPARRPGTHADVAPPAPPMSRQRIALLVLLALTIGATVFLFSRNKGEADVVDAGSREAANAAPDVSGSSGARPNNGMVPTATPPASTTTLDPNAGATSNDKAFLDKKNRFTVRCAQYPFTEEGKQQVYAAYRYLLGEGVNAVGPIGSGDKKSYYLCAFAEAKKSDADAWCDVVKKLRGPAGTKYPFASAYVDNIDHVVNR